MANKFFFFTILLIIPVIIIPFALLNSCGPNAPVISSIDPKIGRMGEIITLTGNYFGESRDESYVSIAGITPTSSSYYLWQENQIIVRVPELGESGLVYVHVKGKKSNGVLFSNYASVPRPFDGEELGLEPKISSVSPQTGAPGSLIIITGNNFGISREISLQAISQQAAIQHSAPQSSVSPPSFGVFFSWDFDSPSNPFAVREPGFIEVSEIELGYEAWSAREIRVRLPDGAVSGNFEVRTSNGISRPVFFDVSEKPGYKNYRDRRSYTITYSVDIRVTEATKPNTLYLWVPKPVNSPSQRNINIVSRSAEPFVENHRGISLYKLDNLGPGAYQSVNFTFSAEVYSVETSIKPSSIKQESTPLSAMYTQNTSLIPSDNQKIKSAVSSIVGREQNPYFKAKAIYDWLLANVKIYYSHSIDTNVVLTFDKKRADQYSAAMLFVTMARAANIPCIPVAGVLVDTGGKTTRHYWAEFWINGFGWIPVDPFMGAGKTVINENQSLASGTIYADGNSIIAGDYYFGNMDNQRIAFSRGEPVISQMENRGRPVSHKQSYSLQNVWEEAVGGLESYSSLWGDITISGIYQ